MFSLAFKFEQLHGSSFLEVLYKKIFLKGSQNSKDKCLKGSQNLSLVSESFLNKLARWSVILLKWSQDNRFVFQGIFRTFKNTEFLNTCEWLLLNSMI